MRNDKSIKGRRGQAAVEYLTTYGWVFFVILVGLGAIAYFGLLNPSRFVPDRCWFGPQLVCEDYLLDSLSTTQGEVFWKVRNNFAKDIRILGVQQVDPDFAVNSCNADIHIGVGKVGEIGCIIDSEFFVSGDKVAVPLQMTFRRNDSATAPQHTVTGEIFSIVN